MKSKVSIDVGFSQNPTAELPEVAGTVHWDLIFSAEAQVIPCGLLVPQSLELRYGRESALLIVNLTSYSELDYVLQGDCADDQVSKQKRDLWRTKLKTFS